MIHVQIRDFLLHGVGDGGGGGAQGVEDGANGCAGLVRQGDLDSVGHSHSTTAPNGTQTQKTQSSMLPVLARANELVQAHDDIVRAQQEQSAGLAAYHQRVVREQAALEKLQVGDALRAVHLQQLGDWLAAMAQAVEELGLLLHPIDAMHQSREALRAKAPPPVPTNAPSSDSTGVDMDTAEAEAAAAFAAAAGPAQQQAERAAAIKAVPQRVLQVFRQVPRVGTAGAGANAGVDTRTLCAVPRTARVMQLLRQTVQALQASLLRQFTSMFEDMLASSGSSGSGSGAEANANANANGGNSSGSAAGAGAGASWQHFLLQSRDWILAYGLLSVLPTALTEPPLAVERTYVRSIDEVLAPLWGRFRFHLQQASGTSAGAASGAGASVQAGAGAGSKSQVLWSFQYCGTFAQLLVDLCAQMTTPAAAAGAAAAVTGNTGTGQARLDGASCLADLLRGLPPSHADTGAETGASATWQGSSIGIGSINTDSLRAASQKFLLNKCVRFFQAHMAATLVVATAHGGLQSVQQRTFVMQLVDKSLALDESLVRLLCSSSSSAPAPAHEGHDASLFAAAAQYHSINY